MRRLFVAPTLLVSVLFVSFAFAQAPERDPAKENPVIEELQKVADKETVDRFVAATQALDNSNYEEAAKLYNQVLEKVPDFDAALRRLGNTYVALGKRKEGQELTAKALAQNRSVANLVSRANSLVASNSADYKPTKKELEEALAVSREAWATSGNKDEDSGYLVAEILLMSNLLEQFKMFAATLKEKLPDSPRAAYYNAISLAEDGHLAAAEAELARSKQLGAPDEFIAPLLTAINQARDDEYFGLGRYRSYIYAAFGLVIAWAVGLFALFVVGWILSKKTLRSIEESDPNDVAGEAHSSLKKIYRRVVTLAGIYYYISQPFVIFLVIFLTLAVIVFFLWVGRIPIYLLLVLVFGGAASIFYMVKTLFTRVKTEDPGRSLTEHEAPGLWQLVRNVAKTINTRPVTEIRITHGTDLAVYERGTFRQKMSDGADRILIVGTAVLNGFDQNAFRAVVAHEYGHFSNRDTAGGDIAFRVNTDIMRVADAIVASETNTYYNLGFHFLRLFHFLFRRITHGASRLQEVLADRVAAHHFGSEAFREGLRHVIRRELEFRHVVDKEVGAALSANRAFANLYELKVEDDTEKNQVEEQFAIAMEQATTEDDTHPSPRDRFRYIEGSRSADIEPLSGNVWDLFADRAAITAEMNQVVENLVRPYTSQFRTE